ncbi:MAG: nuclear transport factor 2 family protein [Candidatus Dormibacteraceae bacterium]
MTTQVVGTRQVFEHHVQALGRGDVEAILSDYTEDSVLITADAVLKGRQAIRAGFEGFVAGIFKPGTYEFTMDTVHVEDDVAYAVWHAKCASVDIVLGTDTFLVKDGKIAVQTFAAKISPHT